MTDYTEQRAHPRQPVSCDAEFRVKGDAKSHHGHVLNLSNGGLFFITDKEVVPTHEVLIKVSKGDGCEEELYASVEVIRCFPSEQENDLFGVACAIWKRYEPSEIGDVFP